jgi:TonB-dependent starch-binding outer membrane protein SusC
MEKRQLLKIDIFSSGYHHLCKVLLIIGIFLAGTLNTVANLSTTTKTVRNYGIQAEQITVTGVVTDDQGVPLPGVTILEKGTKNSAMTDINGNFTITVASGESILVASFFGFENQEIIVGGQTQINITMQPSAENIEEVVVVGYGTVKKSDVTGSVISVSNEQLTDRPVNNVFQALQGKAAGVDITTSLRPGTL